MFGIVLCGGTGTRLWPLTKNQNKHLINVYNKQMVYFPLQTLINAGLTEIMIVAGKGHAGSFLELLGDGSEFGVNLTYTVQKSPSGIAGALGLCKKFAGDNSIAVILGDNIFENQFNFSNFREGAKVFIKRVPNPQRFGVARIRTDSISIFKERNDKLIEIVEKPKLDSLDYELIDKCGWGYAVTGLYLYDSNVFDKISCLRPSNRGELEVSDLNNLYVKEGNMDFDIIDGFWSDMGTFDSLFYASEFVRNKELSKVGNEAKYSLNICSSIAEPL